MDFKINVNNTFINYSEIEPFIKKRQKINAVKYIMNKTQCSKEEAQEIIDDVYQMNNLQNTKTKSIETIQKEFKENNINQNQSIPKCPTCGSINIQKISTGERALSVIGLGLLSKKINKTWKCNNCGHTW